MATRRTTRAKAAPDAAAPAPQPELTPQDLARFLGLKDYNGEQMQALLSAATLEANAFIGAEVAPEQHSHIYRQGILHLAAKFYAVGTSKTEDPSELPIVCRYMFELVRRELSGSAE